MRKLTVVAFVAALSMLTACNSEHSESCEWERKKEQSPTSQQFEGKVGGSSGGRGGSSGSRGGSSGGGSKMGKSSSSGGSGGASKPRYNKSNPAPKPTTNPGVGYYWGWDCD